MDYWQLLSFIIEPNTLWSIIPLLLTQMWLAHSHGKGIMCVLSNGGVNCCNYVALVINEWIWNIGRMTLTGEDRNTLPVPLCLPQIPHRLTWEWTGAYVLRGWQQTAWARYGSYCIRQTNIIWVYEVTAYWSLTLVVQPCRDKAGFDLPPVGVSASSE